MSIIWISANFSSTAVGVNPGACNKRRCFKSYVPNDHKLPRLYIPDADTSLEKGSQPRFELAKRQANGNQIHAAKLLDIGSAAMRNKLKKFGLIRGDDEGSQTDGTEDQHKVGKRFRRRSLFRQDVSPRFDSERNDQQPDPKRNRCKCNRFSESSHSADERAHSEVDSGGHESSERSGGRKRSRAHRGSVLLRQPKTEDREVAAKKSQEKQHRNERV